MPNQRRTALRATAALAPVETTKADQIAALESELLLLAPYASAKGLPALRARCDEIRAAIRRLDGLALGFDLDGETHG